MREREQRWILAFDASCASCREISAVVERACDSKVEVLPLAREDVRGWREASLGPDAPWTPTLIRVAGGTPTSWTGPRLGARLVGRLGPRSTVRVLAALGQLRQHQPATHQPGSVSRAQFLRLGAGAAIAAGFLLTGRVPASAAVLNESRARSWAKANIGNLPQTYTEVTGYPVAYRRAIFEASSPRVRSELWVEQFRTYLRDHPDLPKEKLEIVRRGIAIASQERVFADDVAVRRTFTDQLDRLEQDAKRVFGREEAWALIASLGPAPAPGGTALEDCGICECSSESDWCSSAQYCREIRCDLECDQDHGCHCFSLCGTLNAYECNGYCNRIS